MQVRIQGVSDYLSDLRSTLRSRAGSKARAMRKWHRWFAWHPIIAGDYWSGYSQNRIIWLEKVYRRRQLNKIEYRNMRYPEDE